MTLITYPTRVHFADGVLQEALHSELERSGCRAPLLVYENTLDESEFSYRVQEGMPQVCKVQSLCFSRSSDLRQVAKAAVDPSALPDVVIAYGSARAIELGRKCRYALAQMQGKRPPFYAIPGIDGLPDPCTRALESWRAGLPSVLICDPTVTLNAEPGQSWRAAVLSLARCIESYLAKAYNPPADGMALDALNRCVTNMPKMLTTPGLDVQRELMAAGLNASLSQEKGIGLTLTLAAALADPKTGVGEPELARLILPSVIRHAAPDGDKIEVLLKVVGGSETALDTALERLMDPAPMPHTLSALGVAPEAIEAAAKNVGGNSGPDYDRARKVLDPIY